MHVHVVSHIADLDGLMSALLIKQAEEISGNSVTVRFADYYDYLEKIAQAEGDKIYVADLGIDPLTQPSFKKTIMEKSRRAQVIYIDHHPDDPQVLTHLAQSGTTVVHSREDCAGVLTYDHLKDRLPPRYFLYAVYAAIGDHMERGKLAASLMDKADGILAYFEASLLTLGLVQDDEAQRLHLLEALARDPYYHDPELVQPALRQIEAVSSFISKIRGLSPMASGRFSWLAAEADFFTGRAAYAMLQELPLKISVAYRLDLARSEYQISLRRAEGVEVDLGELSHAAASSCGGDGGGHPAASGARVPQENLGCFLSQIGELLAYFQEAKPSTPSSQPESHNPRRSKAFSSCETRPSSDKRTAQSSHQRRTQHLTRIFLQLPSP